MRLWLLFSLIPGPVMAQTSTWGAAAAPEEAGFSWTDPISPGFWMAWTPATAVFFVAVFGAVAWMGMREFFRPGGHPRRGILGLDTTRGDRLFISCLGSAYIFLAWLGLVGTPLWGAAVGMVLWFALVFSKV